MRPVTKLSSHLSLALLTGLSATLWATPAKACSASSCKPGGYVAPGAGTTIPRNATAIFYQFTRPLEDVGAGISLTTDDGATSIPLTLAPPTNAAGAPYGALFSLGAPLDPSKVYAVRHVQSCTPEQVKPEDYTGHTFSVGPPASLPTSAGSLALADAQRTAVYQVPNDRGSCVAPIDAAVIRLAFTPSPELVPWLPVTSFRVLIDGKVVNGTGLGVDVNAELPGAFYARSPLQLHARCAGVDPSNGWDSVGTSLGAHQVALEATIAGVEAPVRTDLNVAFSCEAAALPGEAGEAGRGGGGAGGMGQGGSGGAAFANADGNGDENSCSLSSSPTSRVDARALATLGVLLTLRLRRRPR